MMQPSNQPETNNPRVAPELAPSESVPSGVIWFNTIMGLLLLYMGWNFARWALATMTGQTFHTNVEWLPDSGNTGEVPYFQLQGHTAWTETGMFLFGLCILIEAAVMTIARGKGSVMFAIALTALATSFNLVVCALVMKDGMMPLMSGLAVAFGGWMIMDLYKKMPRTQG